MRQEEFFESFQEALAGEVSENVIQENIRYYKNYIFEQNQKGRAIDEILDSLGNPRLLAKTIINTSGNSSAYKEAYTEYESNGSGQGFEDAKDHRKLKQKLSELSMPGWLRSIVSMLIIIGVLILAFGVISYLAPFIVFIVCIYLVVRIIRNISDGM